MTDTSVHGGGKTHPGAMQRDGFCINHISGVGWCGDLGNFQVMPATGELNLLSSTYRDALTTRDDRGYESDFSHDTEITEAGYGYYAVTLDTYGIRAETTVSTYKFESQKEKE